MFHGEPQSTCVQLGMETAAPSSQHPTALRKHKAGLGGEIPGSLPHRPYLVGLGYGQELTPLKSPQVTVMHGQIWKPL